MNIMPVIYVAGPYRGLNREAVELNIQSAKAVGLEAIKRGWSPIIPHMNTAHLDALINLDDQFWLDATMALLQRCDALVLCPEWKRSAGTMAELNEAERRGIDIYSIDMLPPAEDYLKFKG